MPVPVPGLAALLRRKKVADPTASARLVNDSLLSHALVPLFEAVWANATPLGSDAHGQITEEERELLTMLASGLMDKAIVRHLDVHTVRRRISRLMQALNVETRFQAGVQAALRGWLKG